MTGTFNGPDRRWKPLAILLLDHAPVDGDIEDPLIVGFDPALGIEDATAPGGIAPQSLAETLGLTWASTP
jgi:hypothetical protein